MVYHGHGLAETDITMDEMGLWLSRYLKKPVQNHTGLQGAWDFEYKTGEDDPEASDTDTIVRSLAEVGIRLRTGTGPVTTIVVDAIEPPTAN